MQSIDGAARQRPNAGLARAVRGPATGSPVVLVHGFTQTKASWDRLPGLGSRRITAVDLPGHGGSSDVRSADMGAAAAALGAAGGRGAYVGYSLGGRTALTLAVARPDLVTALVLVSASAGIADGAARRARRARDDALADEIEAVGDVEVFLDRWFAQPLFAGLSPEAQDRPARAVDAAGLAASLRNQGAGRMPPLWAALGDLSVPVLAVAGRRDAAYVDLAEAMARAIPRGRLAILDGGHAVPFEHPAAFCDLVAGFLDAEGA